MSDRDWKNREAPAGYVNRKQAAAMLGVTPRTLARYIRKGRLRVQVVTDPVPGVPWTYNESFYKLDDLQRFVESEK